MESSHFQTLKNWFSSFKLKNHKNSEFGNFLRFFNTKKQRKDILNGEISSETEISVRRKIWIMLICQILVKSKEESGLTSSSPTYLRTFVNGPSRKGKICLINKDILEKRLKNLL